MVLVLVSPAPITKWFAPSAACASGLCLTIFGGVLLRFGVYASLVVVPVLFHVFFRPRYLQCLLFQFLVAFFFIKLLAVSLGLVCVWLRSSFRIAGVIALESVYTPVFFKQVFMQGVLLFCGFVLLPCQGPYLFYNDISRSRRDEHHLFHVCLSVALHGLWRQFCDCSASGCRHHTVPDDQTCLYSYFFSPCSQELFLKYPSGVCCGHIFSAAFTPHRSHCRAAAALFLMFSHKAEFVRVT